MSGYYWPRGSLLTVGLDPAHAPPLSFDPLTQFDQACAAWEAVCGVRFSAVDPALSAPTALAVWKDVDDFGTPMGLRLGLTDLPAPGVSQLKLRLNRAVGWTPQLFAEVLMHEIGHALGFDHAPPDVRSIMAPVLDERDPGPTEYDAALARQVYGPPFSAAPQPPPPAYVVTLDLPDGKSIDLTVSLGNYR